jgi:hypothetical protein
LDKNGSWFSGLGVMWFSPSCGMYPCGAEAPGTKTRCEYYQIVFKVRKNIQNARHIEDVPGPPPNPPPSPPPAPPKNMLNTSSGLNSPSNVMSPPNGLAAKPGDDDAPPKRDSGSEPCRSYAARLCGSGVELRQGVCDLHVWKRTR